MTAQQLVDDLYLLFTLTPSEIAVRFGESRITSDSSRINYALELMDAQVSRVPSHNPPAEWAMVCATLEAEAAGVSPFDLREAARIAEEELGS